MPRNESDPGRRPRPERRAQQRADNKAKKRDPRSKAPYIVGATIGAAALLGGIVYGRSLNNDSPISQSTPTPGIFPGRINPEMNNLPDSVVIAQEILRLNIQPDAEEQALWETKEPTPIPTNKEEIFQKTQEKIEQTLQKMEKSKIKEFREDAAYIRSITATGELSFAPVYEEALEANEKGSHMATTLYTTPDGKNTKIYLRIALEKTLQENFLADAATLSHESIHIRNRRKEKQEMDQAGLSAIEQLQKRQTRTHEEILAEESDAYAHATRIYITAMGLTDKKESSPTNHYLASTLIKARYNTKENIWRNFIAEITPNSSKK